MNDPIALLNNLTHIQERYKKLQDLFNVFCSEILNFKKDDDRFDILNIEQSENTLSVGFIDRRIEVKFLFFVGENSGRMGYIHCQLISPTEDGEPKIIERISFNGEGVTSFKSNVSHDDDPYIISNRRVAICILLRWVSLSVNENF